MSHQHIKTQELEQEHTLTLVVALVLFGPLMVCLLSFYLAIVIETPARALSPLLILITCLTVIILRTAVLLRRRVASRGQRAEVKIDTEKQNH